MEVASNFRSLGVNWRLFHQCLSTVGCGERIPWRCRHSVRYKSGYGVGKPARVTASLEPDAEEYLAEKNLKPAQHPGIYHLGKVTLPERFRHAAEKILSHENIPRLKENAIFLQNYIWSRRLPIDNERLKEKAFKIEETLLRKDEALLPFISEEQTIKLHQRRSTALLKRLHHTVYHWEPIRYSRTRALEYLLARSAPEFAILSRIFHELHKRDPSFKPKTLCDFGSGLGTVSWAAREYWGGTLLEHLCADVSTEMNDLAELLLRGGNKNNDHSIPALFFRQHLPDSWKIRYDLVVSAFSLMELPSAQDRLTVIDKLWKKTEDALVVVEAGTNAGFRAVLEARNYILGLGPNKKAGSHCHVFSPCPHNLECPRFAFDTIPCNFLAKYRPLHPFHRDDCTNERFCYVVLRRGPAPGGGQVREEKDAQFFWPRLIEEPIVRPRHVICRMCTKKGDVKEVVLTKAKHSQQLRLIAKRSDWGDQIPLDLDQTEDRDATDLQENLDLGPEQDVK